MHFIDLNVVEIFYFLSDGQNMAKRVSKQLQKVTSLLKKAVNKYNEQHFFTSSSAYPLKIDVNQVFQQGSALFSTAPYVCDVSN